MLNALGQLHAEGYLVTERGIGTFVAPNVQQLSMPPDGDATEAGVPSARAAQSLRVGPLAANLNRTAPFRPGMPALDLFPTVQFLRAERATAWKPELLGYDVPFGHLPLRIAIAARLKQTRGIVCSADDIAITNGAQSAFTLIARVMIDKGDRALVEDPGYANLRAALIAEGAQVAGVPVDDHGIIVDAFPKRRAKLVCVTPSHQYPSGAVLSLERRFTLLDWANRHDGWIVEDDYDSEFNYTNRPQPALQGLGDGQRVIYVGTFSKVLSPALRAAYVVVPRALRAAFEATHLITGGPPNTMLQTALAAFIANGSLRRHVSRMRRTYDERRIFVRDELAKRAGSIFDVRDTNAGLHFTALLPRRISDVHFSERAAKRGVILPPLSRYYHDTPPANGVVVGYAAASIESARAAIAALEDLL